MKHWLSFRAKKKSKKDLKLIRFLIKKFGYRPKRLLPFKIALTHKSIANTSNHLISNERLEFLGDTILDAVIADYLYHKFPDENEGYLTKVKSKIVNRKNLVAVAQLMGLSDHIVYQQGRGIRIATLEGNAFEALIGAIYVDGGYEAVKKSVLHRIIRNYIDLPSLLKQEIDFKSRLYIIAQKNHLEMEFKPINEEIKDGKWRYEVEIHINSIPYGRGVGSTKKLAEQTASKETLDLIGIT